MGAFGRPVQRVSVRTESGFLSYPAPNPEDGCVVGGSQRSASEFGLYAPGKACPTQGWLGDGGGGPSWQPLPKG